MKCYFKKSFEVGLLTIVNIFIISLQSCNKDDELPPSIEFILPELNQTFNAGDVIEISVIVSDDKDIEFVKASLTDGASQNFGQATKKPSSYSPYEEIIVGLNIETSIPMNTAEEYFIRLEVSDGENSNVRYRKININASEKQHKGYVIVTGDSTNYQVTLTDTNFTEENTFSHSGVFLDALINSSDKHLVVCGSSSGNLSSFDMVTGGVVWTLDNQNGVPEGYFREIYFDATEDVLYVSLNTGEIKSYTTDGINKGGFLLNNNSKRARGLMASNSHLYYQSFAVNDNFKYMKSAFKGTWVSEYSQQCSFEAIYISGTDGQMLQVFADLEGSSKYYDFNMTTGNYESILTLPSGILKGVRKAGTLGYLLCYTDEVYLYNKQNNVINLIHQGALVSAVAFNEVTQNIIIGDQFGNIKTTTTGGNTIQNFYVGGAVLDIEVYYNK